MSFVGYVMAGGLNEPVASLRGLARTPLTIPLAGIRTFSAIVTALTRFPPEIVKPRTLGVALVVVATPRVIRARVAGKGLVA